MAILASAYRVTAPGPVGLPMSILGLWLRCPMIPLAFTLPVAGPADGDFENLPQVCQEENDNVQVVVYAVDASGNPLNLRGAAATLRFKRPDGTTFVRPASYYTSGLDGGLQYTSTAKDFLQPGVYEVQAAWTMSGQAQTTRRARFRVGANLDV